MCVIENELVLVYTVRIFGDCAGGTARPFRYARSLRRLLRFLVLVAHPPDILTAICYSLAL
jgi:hypothetical protein